MAAPPERSASPPANSDVTPEDEVRTAGRGGAAVLIAKVFFIAVGFVQQPLLKHVIGLSSYGALSRVLAVANVINNVVVAGSVQGASRAVSQAPGKEAETLRALLHIHAPLAVLAATFFALVSPYVARFEAAPHIELPLLVMSLVVLFYGLYAPMVGALNGRKLFVRQAALDVTYAALRTIAMVGLGLVVHRATGGGVVGATLGFAAAAACIVPVAVLVGGYGRKGEHGIRTWPYLRGLLTIAGVQLATNILMQADITVLGRTLSLAAAATQSADAAKVADEWVGVYRASQLYAFLPYQLLFSVTQVLFPMLARAKVSGDKAAIARMLERGTRIALILLGAVLSLVLALPGSLLGFAYGADVATRGAPVLLILAPGQAAFALLGLGTTALTSLGHERRSAVLTGVSGALVLVTTYLVGPTGATLGEMVQRTAMATTGSLVLGLLGAWALVRHAAGAFIPLRPFLRVGLIVLGFALTGQLVPLLGKIATIGASACVLVAYCVSLVVTGELGRDDWLHVKQVLARKRR